MLVDPRSAQTIGMIGKRELELLRPGALLVNTARAPIVDREAVSAALHEGSLGGFATDVHWQEPVTSPHLDRLYTHPRVLATPHSAPNVPETWEAIASHCATCIEACIDGHELPSQVCS